MNTSTRQTTTPTQSNSDGRERITLMWFNSKWNGNSLQVSLRWRCRHKINILRNKCFFTRGNPIFHHDTFIYLFIFYGVTLWFYGSQVKHLKVVLPRFIRTNGSEWNPDWVQQVWVFKRREAQKLRASQWILEWLDGQKNKRRSKTVAVLDSYGS